MGSRSTKLPAFQFYPGDWRKDPGVQSLDYFERGVWVELLCLMHESDMPGRLMIGGAPYPEDRLARVLCLSMEVMGKVISNLITLGVASKCPETGALMCRRMVRDREISKIRGQSGKLGGNPNFQKGQPNPYYRGDNQKDNHNDKQNVDNQDKQKITPSSSSSASADPTKIPAAWPPEAPDQSELPDLPDPPGNEKHADPRHAEISRRWGDLFKGAFGAAYHFTGRDAKALHRFLKSTKDAGEEIITVAIRAWERSKQDRFCAFCKQAATIHGLCGAYNGIRVELQTPTNNENRNGNTRGFSQQQGYDGVTDK